ncbi:MAG TPA: hypothetical protein VFC39_13050 [Acidobacteriaceae bacterium]|nr:hypothetical protein [Acidobacteriaceae bacterium]
MNKVSKSILSAFIFAFGLPLMGQVAVYVFPQKRQIAVNGIQTFTAVVTGASNKGISWSASCGNIIKGLNSTIGLKNGTQQDCTVTATSIADKTKSASGAVSYVASPHFQEGIHPRLLLTPAMVETMRTGGWATAANPYWKNGLAKTAANAVAEVDAKWCFSFGGYCPPGSKRGQPMHFYAPTLYAAPAVKTLSRDASGTVTATMGSAFDIWKGATVTITPAPADRANFAKGPVVVTSVSDATHFTYKQSGPAGVSAADGALSFSCGRLNGDTWCDTGGYKTPIFDATETYTELFAFLSLIDPNATNQEHYRIRAHDMMMWMINLAGDTTQETCTASAHHAPSTPFQNCAFPINDRAHQAGMEAFPLTVDWIYSAFTPSEKKKITHVFRWWAHQCITTSPTGIPYPLPFGVMNDPVLLSNPKRLRWLMNNLGDSQYRTLTMLGVVMDAADDPSDDGVAAHRGDVTPLKDGLKTNSLEGYSELSQGAWTYIHWAEAEDPGIVSTALGVSPAGLGEAQGGLSPEGSEYGGNYGYIAMGLLSLYTAGADDPTHMPQLSFMNSSNWDLWIDGLLNTISPVPRSDRSGSYYESTQFGDDHVGNFLSANYLKLLMPLGLYDYYTRTDPRRLNAIRWLAKYAVRGGCGDGPNGACGSSSQFLYRRLTSTVATNDFNMPIYTFLLLDPAATPNSPTNPSGDIDPRPQYPTEFYAPGHHEMAARTSWQPDASWIVTHCNWLGIDHQRGDCGQTEFYRDGRWLSKAHATYMNVVGALTMFSNSGITIGNPDNDPREDDHYYLAASRGSQYGSGGAGGFSPSPLLSSGPTYVHEYFDQTETHNDNLQNHFPTSDVLHASRSLVWLKPDILIYYDRGISRSAGMFKRDSFNFTAMPVVTGQVAKVVDSVTKQETFLTSLLPLPQDFAAMVCAYGSSVGDCAGSDVSAGGDESAFLYQVSYKSPPLAADFLSVMEGADPGRPETPASLVEANGTPMDGAVVGNSIVLFTKTPWLAIRSFTTTSYSVPVSVLNHYVSGLQPDTVYGVEIQAAGDKINVSVTKRCSADCLATDNAGLLAFTATAAGKVTTGSAPYKGTH